MLIGLAGLAGSGKDTVAAYINECEKHTLRISFATPIKRAVLAMFADVGVTDAMVFGPSGLRASSIGGLRHEDGTPISVRHALQTLGTEWGRKCLHPDVWANLGVATAQQALRAGGVRIAVITDVRFENEMKAIRAAGGELWHIDRPGAGLAGAAGHHASERDITPGVRGRGPFGLFARRPSPIERLRTEHILNTGTLTWLRQRVRDLIDTRVYLDKVARQE